MRTEEPWPLLLPDNSAASTGRHAAAQRANGALEKLVQSARRV